MGRPGRIRTRRAGGRPVRPATRPRIAACARPGPDPMSTALRQRPAETGAGHGGTPARRAVVRWAWRLPRREWRQQLLVLALLLRAQPPVEPAPRLRARKWSRGWRSRSNSRARQCATGPRRTAGERERNRRIARQPQRPHPRLSRRPAGPCHLPRINRRTRQRICRHPGAAAALRDQSGRDRPRHPAHVAP
jgi:hypothetical protein